MNNLEITNQMLALLKDEKHKLLEGLARINIQIQSLENLKNTDQLDLINDNLLKEDFK